MRRQESAPSTAWCGPEPEQDPEQFPWAAGVGSLRVRGQGWQGSRGLGSAETLAAVGEGVPEEQRRHEATRARLTTAAAGDEGSSPG